MKRTIFAATVALAVSGCGPAPQKKTITFGAVLSVTGDLASIGSEQLDAAQLAAEQITAQGGVLGSDLVISNKDDATDVAKAKTAAEALVAAKVPVIIGAVGSSFSLAVNEAARAANVVQLSASSTSPLLTTAPDDGTLFRACASDALQAKLLAKRAKAKGFKRVATIYVPGAYGQGLSDTFAAEFTAGDGTTSTTIKKEYVAGQSSYTALLTEVFATNPEAIVLVGYPVDSAQIIKDYLQTFSTKDVFWYFPDALEDSGFVTAVGTAFTFQHEGTGPSTPSGATYDAFKTAFKTKYGKDPSPGTYSVHAYDAVYLAALATAAGASADGAVIKTKLVGVSAGGAAVTAADFKQAATDAAAGKDIDYVGASGSVDMDANGDVVTNYDTWKVSGTSITVTESGLAP